MDSSSCPDSKAAFSPEDITAQLDRILASDTFADAPGLRQLLGYVVAEIPGGHTDDIKDFSIAQDVFRRDNQTDAQDSTSVRVEADRLRRRLHDYYLKEGQQDPIQIRIPKGGYVPLFDGLTPATGGIAADRPAFEPPRARPSRASRTVILAFIAIMLFLFALLRIYLLVGNDNLPSGNNTFPAKPAIAALLFADTTHDTYRTALINCQGQPGCDTRIHGYMRAA